VNTVTQNIIMSRPCYLETLVVNSVGRTSVH